MAQPERSPSAPAPRTSEPAEETAAPPPSPLRRVGVLPRLLLDRAILDAVVERTPTPRPPPCPEEGESPSSE